ncbi:MAG: ABC transporter substrate-binding protein [Oscillospiraceae bacterium]|nr:ABC transporter substrate-binding protein [Oscillospiraceae bacterium]
MNVKIKSLILAAMLVLSLAACSYNAPQTQKDVFYTFTDHSGSQVVLTQQPQRVAVLFSSFADIWQTAGGNVDITVGETVERGFADSSAVLVDGGAGKTIDNEALVAANPDFVICSADIAAQNETAQLLKSAGIPCAVFRVETFEDYLQVLKICTDITGRQDLYRKHGTDVQDNITKLLSQVQNTDTKILFVRAGSGASATKAKTARDHFAAQMLKELGTYNIAENAPVLLDGLSLEEIITQNPQYIFISTMGDEAAAKAYIQSVFTQPQWQVLDAVKNQNYIFLPKELFQYKPNSRWDMAYQYLLNILYEQQ